VLSGIPFYLMWKAQIVKRVGRGPSEYADQTGED